MPRPWMDAGSAKSPRAERRGLVAQVLADEADLLAVARVVGDDLLRAAP